MYFFSFYQVKTVHLEGELVYSVVKTIVSEVPVFHSKSLTLSKISRAIEISQQFFINTQQNNIDYNIFRFKNINGSFFHKTSPYDHFNLCVVIQELNDLFVTHQLTTHVNSNLQLEFTEITNRDIYDRVAQQFISNTVRVLDASQLEPYNKESITSKDISLFIARNELNIYSNFIKSLNIK